MALVQSVIFFPSLKGQFKRHRRFSDFNAISQDSDPRIRIQGSNRVWNPDFNRVHIADLRIDRGASVEAYVFTTEPLIHCI